MPVPAEWNPGNWARTASPDAGISTKVLAIHLKSSHLRSRALQLLLVLPSQCLTVVSCDFPENLCIHLASVTHISAQGRASLRELSRKGKLGKYAHISQVLGAFLWLPHVQSSHVRSRSRLMAGPAMSYAAAIRETRTTMLLLTPGLQADDRSCHKNELMCSTSLHQNSKKQRLVFSAPGLEGLRFASKAGGRSVRPRA